LPFFPKHDIREKVKCFPRGEVATSTFRNDHVDMRIPLEVTTEGMERTDDSRSKGFLVIEGVHPVSDYLSRRFEKKIKKGAVLSKEFTKLLGNRKDNVPVATVDQLCGDGIGTICLIGGAAGIAETRFTAKWDIVKVIAVMTVVETIALFQITTIKHFFNLILNDRTNAWSGREERGPVILKYLLDRIL